MLKLELFFKIVESEIRRKHIKYLKKQKCNSAAKELSPVSETENVEDEFPVSEKIKYVKRFNKGIETALKVLQDEFENFSKRFADENKTFKK